MMKRERYGWRLDSYDSKVEVRITLWPWEFDGLIITTIKFAHAIYREFFQKQILKISV